MTRDAPLSFDREASDDDVSGEPQVLSVRGLGAHSGGLALDVTYLLLAGAGAVGLTLVTHALRGRDADSTATSTAPPPTSDPRPP